MSDLRNATLIFLVKRTGGEITEICLAMKKRGFGKGRWNGVGGKVEAGETIEAAAMREAREEIGVTLAKLMKVAELTFRFPHNPAFDQLVHVYLTHTWEGTPAESEEMDPRWFAVGDIPFSTMWPDDEFWLPSVVAGDKVRGSFTFGEGDVVEQQAVSVVNTL